MRKMFSKKQIEKMALDSVKEGFKSEDVVVKTISQSEANWSFPISIEGLTFEEGLEATLIYGRFEVINNILFFVSSMKVVNTTSNEITMSEKSINVDIPSSIGDKIFDIEGKKVSEAITTATLITEYYIFKSNRAGSATASLGRIYNQNTANRLGFRLANQVAIGANDTAYFTFRTFLTIL